MGLIAPDVVGLDTRAGFAAAPVASQQVKRCRAQLHPPMSMLLAVIGVRTALFEVCSDYPLLPAQAQDAVVVPVSQAVPSALPTLRVRRDRAEPVFLLPM